jgi:hypothetical protein
MITEIENFASWLADRMELEIEASQRPPESPMVAETIMAPVPAPVMPTPPPAPVPAAPTWAAAPVSAPSAPVARPVTAAPKTSPVPVSAPAPVASPPATPPGPMPPGDPAVAAAERYLRLDVSEDGQH